MLQKQPVSLNFAQGIDTKTDPYQIPMGKFSALINTVFTTTGRLTKRFGFNNITRLPDTNQITLTTLNDNLIATGTNLLAFSQDTNEWLNQGIVQPVQLDTQPLIRVSTSQDSPDTAIASNGLVCLAYMDNGASYYQVSDSVTGQQIVNRVTLPATSVNPRVFLLGNWFIITFVMTVTGTPTLRFIAIPWRMPSNPNIPMTISSNLNGLQAGYDAYVANDTLFIAWGESTANIAVTYITPALAIGTPVVVAGHTADLMSVTADLTNHIVWVTYWEDSSDDGFTTAFNYILGQLVTQTQIINNTEIREITSVVTDGILRVFYENVNNYSYLDSSGDPIETDFISNVDVTPPIGIGPGTPTAPVVTLRSVGLASKAFIDDTTGMIYMLAVYGPKDNVNSLDDSNQPSYFLINSDGDIYMRLAYSNGGGYMTTQVLPSVSLLDDSFYVPYRLADFLTTVNKGTSLPSGTPTNAIYTQTGINLAKFSLDVTGQHSSEIAGALHLTGGQLWEYDSVRPVEHGFQVWPENVQGVTSGTAGSIEPSTYNYVFTYEWTDNQGMLHRSAPSIPFTVVVNTGGSFTANIANGADLIIAIPDINFDYLQVGQHVTGTNIPVNTVIIAVDRTNHTITISHAATGTATETITITPATSIDINVPTLRLTYKLAPNPVRIVGYRWSTAQQVYYQFTSYTSPIINDPTIDSVAINDGKTDSQILGQTLLYTTGGVLENIAAPASIASALFSNRLWLITAEDRNLLWYSKLVIENTPVEMSDALTIYVAPTTGAQGSTGDMTALGAMDDKLIVFKANAIYYINGSGPDSTGANSTFSDAIFVTAAVGCANPDSVVLIPTGTMFQSDKGIWLLGRDLSTQYIGAPVEAYNSQPVLSARVIPGTTQVRFILGNNVTLVYDYFYNQWSTHTNIAAISSTLYQGVHTYLNSYGQVFKESNDFIDGSSPVLIGLTTSWINIAGVQGFERFYFANLLGTYYSPFKLNVSFAYNYNPSPIQNVLVLPEGNPSVPWGGEALWGSGAQWGGSQGNVFSARVFPEMQKCQSFQVSITEVYDPSLGQAPGQGLSLSGLALIVGMKRGFRTQSAKRSFG